jgi:hypothetical protein
LWTRFLRSHNFDKTAGGVADLDRLDRRVDFRLVGRRPADLAAPAIAVGRDVALNFISSLFP